jgi:hypothetical protein
MKVATSGDTVGTEEHTFTGFSRGVLSVLRGGKCLS